MFTGLIEEVGVVSGVKHSSREGILTIRSSIAVQDTALGDSIAVNGVCLTVTHLTSNSFSVGVAPETWSRSNLDQTKQGDHVNLERALTPQGRMGGHIVQGHIDGVGTVTRISRDGSSKHVHIGVNDEFAMHVVPKGFVALDGVSLTVVEVHKKSFSVMLIDYTQQHITLTDKRVGYSINIETDIIGKYIDQLGSQRQRTKTPMSLAFLASHGYK